MELYLDCNATTPVAAEVVAAMAPCWRDLAGNPSSLHRAGRRAHHVVEQARSQVGALLGVGGDHVLFTASGTEANHLALRGLFAADRCGTVAIGATEHASLRGAAEMLQRQGWKLLILEVDHNGWLTTAALDQLERQRPELVSVMVANNETGVIQPLAPLQQRLQRYGGRLHLDATQAAGKIPLQFDRLRADVVTLSAHKIYGPKGIGAVIKAPDVTLQPLLLGGGQERGVRAGTENVPAIVGFGEAAALALSDLETTATRLLSLRNTLEQALERMTGVEIVARSVERLPNTVMCLTTSLEGGTLLLLLDRQGIALSSGSACQAGKRTANPVLQAMGVPPERARNAIRISLCRDTDSADIERLIVALEQQLQPVGGGISGKGDF